MFEANSTPLFIEMGNSAWKAARATSQTDILVACGRGETTLQLHAWLAQQPEQTLVLASVGSEAEVVALVDTLCEKGYHVMRATTGEAADFKHCYQEPQMLGVDRWLTMLALRSRKQNCVILDAGTAFTLDVLDANGQHLGGWISPGLKLMQHALVSRSERLHVNEEWVPGGLGSSTQDAIGLGCQAALQGVCEQAIERARALLPHADLEVFLTGGDIRYLNLERIGAHQHRPLLVLEGLYTWWREQL
ncbi:hypothetical protein CWE15_09670 [Aliidiomarina taiwanensis]|uniref:Type III pantothenate kinase n=1 Tax=Aliidiomarina taiwanensis TaxID=946228 RepID=A0A432WZY6_9GAMM|nr:type III pantothenate kinase [Aliidiomarina taiwanensis]RUO39381.1 hypothetical protein CWE15_09670 [Aliidiomarina taiwanensis]